MADLDLSSYSSSDSEEERNLAVNSLDNNVSFERDEPNEVVRNEPEEIDRSGEANEPNEVVRFKSEEEAEEDEEEGNKSALKIITKISSCNVPETHFPSLVPLGGGAVPEISSASLLAALEEEPGIKDPAALHGNCCEAANTLKAGHALDRYVVSEAEAAVLCTIPMLLDSGFSLRGMVESCTEKEKKGPSKLLVMMLTVLRKLPRYRGVMYIESAKRDKGIRRKEDEIIQLPICVATKKMVDGENNGKDKERRYREVFKVEHGWGYDMSDFVLRRDENGAYGT